LAGLRRGVWLLGWVWGLALTACAGRGPASTPTPTPPAPQTVLLRAAERLQSQPGFHFLIDRQGALAYLDAQEALAFGQAEGDFVAPDKARALVRIIGPGLITDVSVITIGRIQWETNVLTGRWQELPPDWGFNPTLLFDPDRGLSAILQTDAFDLTPTTYVAWEASPDAAVYYVRGQLSGERVYTLSGRLIDSETMQFELWAQPETYDLLQVRVTEPVQAGETSGSVWVVTFSAWGQQVAIAPPTVP
jgi:lipoprotein LprG